MIAPRILLSALATLCLAAPAFAQAEAAPSEAPTPPPAPAMVTVDSAVTLTLNSSSDIERKVAGYQCDDGSNLSVQYINAAPNYLAIVPVEGESHLFTTALSGSGARYVSGPYEWWEAGDEATLRDVTQGEDAPPLSICSPISNTP